ncbi:MucB/RseB C-terminal domain-containing protein [Oceanobacter sp. 3_MG-2023]|uniref:MucB/RseB C-terminal domain-containing protein n=1 Tax=Oceanobacter sp. 3_MG-2023 TaxID=3062622 RepID=UPI0027366C95|nr:MucB/RseB C-terminal domain-containing protein [Oceanobacter sp. 3_MG-2023]MDP2506805.1 MucB/RseB C-terminal domain-containing protein [Oceanobacter sp. 3_MG-2023]
MRAAWCVLTLGLALVNPVNASPAGSDNQITDNAIASVHASGPRQWLARMSHAIKEVNYQGVLVFGNDRLWHTMAISHAMVDGVEYEKISHLTGHPREIIRVGQDVSCTHPDDQALRMYDQTANLLSGIDPDLPALGSYYQIRQARSERIAGRDALQIQVVPNDTFRFGQNLWLDKETGLLLRSDLVDQSRQVIERYQFAEIRIGQSIPSTEFDAPPDSHQYVSHFGASAATALIQHQQDWYPDWVPPGFTRSTESDATAGAALLYSDGLSAFTLFVDQVEQDSMPDMSRRWGATAAVVRHQRAGERRMRITVVGELPMATAKRIALSVRYAGNHPISER